LDIFSTWEAWVVALALAAVMLLAHAAGHLFGTRLRALGADTAPGKGEEASLALLGLLLAFTFSIALGKHEKRRDMVLAESNAIGDFWTCAGMLPEPSRRLLQAEVRAYVERRLAAVRSSRDLSQLQDHFDESQAALDRMSRLMADEIARGSPVATPLLNTFNGVGSAFASRVVAAGDRLPPSIVELLFLSAVLPMFLLGRSAGGSRLVPESPLLVFLSLVVLVVYVTLDVNQPRRGLITVSQLPMELLLKGMGGAAPR